MGENEDVILCSTDARDYSIHRKAFLMVCPLLTYLKPQQTESFLCIPHAPASYPTTSQPSHAVSRTLHQHQFINDAKWNTRLSNKAIQGRSWTAVTGDAYEKVMQWHCHLLAMQFKTHKLYQMVTILSYWNTSELKFVLKQEPVWPKPPQVP